MNVLQSTRSSLCVLFLSTSCFISNIVPLFSFLQMLMKSMSHACRLVSSERRLCLSLYLFPAWLPRWWIWLVSVIWVVHEHVDCFGLNDSCSPLNLLLRASMYLKFDSYLVLHRLSTFFFCPLSLRQDQGELHLPFVCWCWYFSYPITASQCASRQDFCVSSCAFCSWWVIAMCMLTLIFLVFFCAHLCCAVT